jgi:hypothetical protein
MQGEIEEVKRKDARDESSAGCKFTVLLLRYPAMYLPNGRIPIFVCKLDSSVMITLIVFIRYNSLCWSVCDRVISVT